MPVAEVVDGVRDVDEVLEELRGHALVGRVLARQLERDGEHVQAVHAHPARAVGLFEVSPAGQRRRAIEHPDVVEAEEATMEDVAPLGVLAVHPPREVQQELPEHGLEERAVAPAPPLLLDLVDA